MQPPVPGPPTPPYAVRPVAYPGPPSPYGVHPGPPAPYPYGHGPYGYQPNPYGYQPNPYGHQPSPYGGGYPPPYRPRIGLPRPVAVAPVAGTSFGVALVEVRPTASGPAIASLVAGLGSVLVSTAVIFFAAAGASDGWGPAVAGAFAALAVMIGGASVALGGVALRRIRSSAPWGPTQGRGVAVSGLVIGAFGLAITALTMLIALLT